MAKITSGPVMQDRIGGVYDIGAHSVDYVITDLEGNQAFCSFKIKVTGTVKLAFIRHQIIIITRLTREFDPSCT